MKRILLLASCLLLAACNTTDKPLHIPTGEEVTPPGGWIDYCKRNPTDADCGN